MKYLSEYTQEATTQALNKNGGIFAFSTQQFDEQKQEGKIYVSMGAGLYCPKENAETLFNEIEQAHKNGILQDVAENGAEKIIEREYFNYEMHISWDATSFKDNMKQYQEIFPEKFTDLQIRQVCDKCYRKAIDNDWI